MLAAMIIASRTASIGVAIEFFETGTGSGDGVDVVEVAGLPQDQISQGQSCIMMISHVLNTIHKMNTHNDILL